MSTTITIHVTALAPIAHGSMDGGDIGNAVAVRRLAVVGLPGMPRVPVISGNSVRGQLRRILMRDLLDLCGLSRETVAPRAWDRIYASLVNGGHLSGKGDTRVDPQAIRELREALPALSLLGCAMYSHMIEGRMYSGWLWPVCSETLAAGLVSPREGVPVVAAEDLVIETSLVRHIEREQHDPAVSEVTPMPVTMEAIGPGAVLQAKLDCRGTPLEASCLAWGLSRISVLGGKSGAGMGTVRVEHDGDPAAYDAWRAGDLTAAKAALAGLVEKLGKAAK